MRKLPAAMHLTLLPDPGKETTVFHLLTQYPEQEKPLTNTFMARRAGPRNTFVSVFESTVADHPSSVLQAESAGISSSAVKVQISTTDKDIAIVNVSGKNPIKHEGFETDAAYAVVVRSKQNTGAMLIALGAGTYFRMDENAVILADNAHPTTAVFSGIGKQADIRFSEPVEYITHAGGNEYRQPRTVVGLVHFAKDRSRHFQQNTVAN